MLAALSAASAQGLWILCPPDASRIISHVSWTDNESTGLSTELSPRFEQLLASARVKREDLSGLFGVTGPGAFTGLRMSSAFLQGLARALDIAVKAVPSYDLVGAPFWIPLRHQKARELTLPECLSSGIEFLHIKDRELCDLGTPQEGDLILGTKSKPHWPNPNELLKGVRANLHSATGLKIHYGLEPKISGQR